MNFGFASEKLQVGELYSRESLAKQLLTTAATLKNGVSGPKACSSVWPFVTRNKPANRTQYARLIPLLQLQ